MLNIPSPRFNEQDSATPIANLNTTLIVGDVARLTLNFPVENGDRIYLTLSSSIFGGEHNQSFQIAQNAPKIELLIPKSIVEMSAGNVVHLLLSIQRTGQPRTSAPTGRVLINKLPIIIVPTPGTVWDFSNGFQGWVAQGPYTGSLLHVNNSTVRLDPTLFTATRAHIITRPVPVVAGRTYDCSFVAIGGAATSDGSTLYMTMNGTRIGANVQNLTLGQPQTGTGTFTATTTGDVRLGIFNDAVPNGLHGLSLSNVRMTPRP